MTQMYLKHYLSTWSIGFSEIVIQIYFSDELNNLEGPNRVIVPFLACGDLSGFDSDKTYPLRVKYSILCLLYLLGQLI